MQSGNRRQFIGLGGAAGLLMVPGCSVARPATIGAEITPEAYGAGNGDAIADTRAWNRAVAESAGTGRPIVANGVYQLRAPSASRWNWSREPSAPVHVAVALRSGVTIQGSGTILVAPPERPASDRNERHVLFGTDLNVRAGSVKDVAFDGLTFDFREELGPVHRYTYAIGVTGVDNLKRDNLTITSTGVLAGRGLLSENVRGRADRNIRHANIIQGVYTRYERGVSMRTIRFDTFNEALDFDGPCWDVLLDDLEFRNGRREAQCIDVGCGSNWSVSNINARDTGAIAYIYSKGNAWPTYAGWLDSGGATAPDPVPPSDMTFRNVRADNAGWARRNGEALRVGSYRNRQWLRRSSADSPIPTNITIQDWTLSSGGQIAVNDCQNLVLHNIAMDGTGVPDEPGANAAIVLREAGTDAGGRVTGRVSNVMIRNPTGLALSVVAGPGLTVSNVSIEGRTAPGPAVILSPRPGARDLPVVTDVRIDGAAASAGDIETTPPLTAAAIAAQAAEERRQRRIERRAGPQRAPSNRRQRPELGT